MTQKKDKQLVIGIEPVFFELVRKIDKGNTAQYVRDLIVTDLNARGLLTEDILKELYELESTVSSDA